MAHAPPEHGEVKSQAELNSTEVSPLVARLLSWGFVLVITAVPLLQTAIELGRKQRLQALDVFLRPPTRETLRAFEDALDNAAVVKRFLQPRLQELVSGTLGFGNDKGVLGRDGWLFYQPGIDYLTGPGILDGAHLLRRAKKMVDKQGEKDPHPDPRPAILQFHRACEEAGVHLVLAPLPDKAMLQPAQLTARLAFTAPKPVPNNSDFAQFIAGLRAAGVDVFDPTPPLLHPGEVRCLRQDTHWTPQWMEEVARGLAAYVRERVDLGPPRRAWRVEERQASRVGDIVDLLKLAPDQRLYEPQIVTLRRVVDETAGTPWQSHPTADVVLLGDSFTNIYTDGPEGLGWGDAAGFGAQLARFLERDLDVIARNGSGATLTRAELARRPDPFGGKRVVIWEFAVRDLACENWKPIAFKPKAPGTAAPPSAQEELVLVGELLSTLPGADQIRRDLKTYRNATGYLKFKATKVEKGKYESPEVLAVVTIVKALEFQPAAGFRPGQACRLVLTRRFPSNVQEWKAFGETEEVELEAFWALDVQVLP
jgi:alginate O-acetyltransferase complex protein AlgJ